MPLHGLAVEDGKITKTEQKKMDEVRKMMEDVFAHADVDNDGKVDLWEVMAYVLGRKKQPVELLLYDISKGMAAKLGPLLLGKSAEAVHTGVLVYNSEYWYGGKLFRSNPPCRKQFGEPLQNPWGIQLERSEQMPELPVVRLGYTFVTHEEFVQWLREGVQERYTGLHTYDLLTHSCNHFSNEVCNFLLGQGIPEKIFELQKTFLSGPIVALRPFLNRYLGGFADAEKNLDENYMSKDHDAKAAESPEDLKKELLGSGDVVLVEGVDGIHGSVLATVLKEKDGKCEIKYFDPTEGRIETMSGVPVSKMKKTTKDCDSAAFAFLEKVMRPSEHSLTAHFALPGFGPKGRSNPATPRVQVAPPRYVQPVLVPTPRSYQATPSYTAQVQSARSHSSSPNPHGASVNLRPPEEPFAARATPPVPSVPPRVASPAVTAVSTPRFTNEVDAMAQAAAQAVAKAAPGMSIVVRPVSQTQAAMLAKRHATPAEDASCPFCHQKIFADAVFCRHCGGKLREDPDASKAPDLRSCQVEIAGLKKQVDSLGRACRGFQLCRGDMLILNNRVQVSERVNMESIEGPFQLNPGEEVPLVCFQFKMSHFGCKAYFAAGTEEGTRHLKLQTIFEDSRNSLIEEQRYFLANEWNTTKPYTRLKCGFSDRGHTNVFTLEYDMLCPITLPHSAGVHMLVLTLRTWYTSMVSCVMHIVSARDLPFATHSMIVENTLTVSVREEDLLRSEACPICLETFQVGDKVRRLPCMHCFHMVGGEPSSSQGRHCNIDKHLVVNKQCPVCKTPIDIMERLENDRNSTVVSSESTMAITSGTAEPPAQPQATEARPAPAPAPTALEAAETSESSPRLPEQAAELERVVRSLQSRWLQIQDVVAGVQQMLHYIEELKVTKTTPSV
ncbi:unnamed protein product [Effrenium voratum]|nr:unnamed protein product [Effrenium voratum]